MFYEKMSVVVLVMIVDSVSVVCKGDHEKVYLVNLCFKNLMNNSWNKAPFSRSFSWLVLPRIGYLLRCIRYAWVKLCSDVYWMFESGIMHISQGSGIVAKRVSSTVRVRSRFEKPRPLAGAKLYALFEFLRDVSWLATKME